jgi:hypothetical protein
MLSKIGAILMGGNRIGHTHGIFPKGHRNVSLQLATFLGEKIIC